MALATTLNIPIFEHISMSALILFVINVVAYNTGFTPAIIII